MLRVAKVAEHVQAAAAAAAGGGGAPSPEILLTQEGRAATLVLNRA